MTITLRDTQPEDQAFLLEVYTTTRAEELALVPWTEDQRAAFVSMQFNAQDSYYRAEYPEASYQVILDDGERVGRLYVLREPEEIRILDITVLPQYRCKGIGSQLLRELLDEGAKTGANPGKRILIWVEHFNPSLKLFERLGFVKIEEDGFNCQLECRPGTDQQSDSRSPD
jgi:ribosomal protein S18 acetylase RimI-like enzyme